MKIMFKYIIPIWINMVISTLLSITDITFLKSIDMNYISVIGIAMIPFSVIETLFVGLGIEANRSIASNRKVPLNMILGIGIVSSLLVCVLCVMLSPLLFKFVQYNASLQEILSYFNIFIFSLIPSTVLYLCTGTMRGMDLAQKTIKFSVLAVVLNFVLDFLFIKNNIFNSALRGCAFASVLSDAITAICYVAYLLKMNIIQFEKIINQASAAQQFLYNSFTYSMEKLFSTSSLTILSDFYVATLALRETTIYYGFSKLFAPILMLAYSYFEWIIYSKSKGIKNNYYKTYLIFAFLILIMGGYAARYLKLPLSYTPIILLFAVYYLLFFIERQNVALLFQHEMGGLANKIILVKSLVTLFAFQLLSMNHTLTLYYAIGIQSLTMAFGSIFMCYTNRKLAFRID